MTEAFKGRREDLRLITGRGRYTADWERPGQLFGHFLRSDRAHAEIVRIDITEASATPGVAGVFRGEDIAEAGFKNPRPIVRFQGKDGSVLKVPHRYALAHERVRFVGEPLALVVAETEAAAQDAAERIFVDYRDLPAVIDPADALKREAPQLHADAPGNLALDYEYGSRAPTEEAFAKAAHIARITLRAQRICANPMEPKACLAAFHPANGSFDLYIPTQGTSELCSELAYVTGLEPEKFRVHSEDVGGAFGVRNELYPEFLAVLFAAQQLQRPVKWVGSRAETILSDHHGRGLDLSGELALDAGGHFLAMRVEWLVDLGAFCSNAGPTINTAAAPTLMAVNVYKTPAFYGLNRLVFTNLTPATAYRGAARPSVAYLVERLVDEAAHITGIDRIELRRRNLLPKDAFPYKTPTGSTYDSGDPEGLLTHALREADWSSFERRRAEASARGRLRGIGCATFIEPSGGGGQEEIAIRFDADGGARLFTLAGPSGQGHETVFPALVADMLGMSADKVTLRYGDPQAPALVGTGSFGSRSLISHGGALAVGAKEVISRGVLLAAKALEVAVDDLVFEHGRYRVPGTDLTIGLEELARMYASTEPHPLDVVTKINTAAAFPSGAHVAEVEIDSETGVLDIVRYTAVDDCGKIYNHVLVEGQIVGGLVQGIGQILGEHCVYERETGQLLTGTFQDYFMPRADCLPALSLHERSVPSPSNPLGAKGAGEAGTTGAIPCIANAVMDALHPLGIDRLDTPFTPHRLWAAINDARREEAQHQQTQA
jgi:carbon-monoxide dehydrogenase large subunit